MKENSPSAESTRSQQHFHLHNEAESYKHTDPGISEDLPSDRNQSLPTDKTSGGGNIQRNTGNVNK